VFVIFGASGKVGSVTAEVLREGGHRVRAVIRGNRHTEALTRIGCEIVLADLTDLASVTRAIDGAQAVQILCPLPIGEPRLDRAMRAMIDIAVQALSANPPPRVLALSDYGAERESGTGITMLFHYLEMQLRRVPTSLTLLRASEHMQNWARVVTLASATGVLPSFHHPLTKRFPTVAAQDVGRLAAELLLDETHRNGPRVVSIEGPQRVSALDVARTLSALSGQEIVAHAVPRAGWIATLVGAGLGADHAQLIADLYDAHNAGCIDVEARVSEQRLGTSDLREVLASRAQNPQ
jgi:NAD(P)H dehydrogenase (quinone)